MNPDEKLVEETQRNAAALIAEMEWFSQVLDVRMRLHFGESCDYQEVFDLPPPNPEQHPSNYMEVVTYYRLGFAERIILILCLIPEVRPQLLDALFMRNETTQRGYTEFGGTLGMSHGGFIPTAETALFILAGSNIDVRNELTKIFTLDHFFFKHNMVQRIRHHEHEPLMSTTLSITREYLEYFTTGNLYQPEFSVKFPAKRITSSLEWEDLVLDPVVKIRLEEVLAWIRHGDTLLDEWGLRKRIKPGYRCLFYGPSGTGKTLAATLLGKVTGVDVFRVDLSSVISKYIGETEKNLASLFDQAENKRWILFFDEADALFTKRVESRSSNDRSANQQIAYLLQRVETFPGVVILATNLKKNMDAAFTRRFDAIINFPMPAKEQRLELWERNFGGLPAPEGAGDAVAYQLDADVNLSRVADQYELAGGNIVNVLRFSCIQAIMRDEKTIRMADIREGIRREFQKAGRVP